MLHQQRLSNANVKDSVPGSQDVSVPMETSVDTTSETVDATNVVNEEATEENKGDETINLPKRVVALEQELNEIIQRSDGNSEQEVREIVKPKLGWDRIVKRRDVGLTSDGHREIKLRDHSCWDSNYDDKSVWPHWGVDKDFDSKEGWQYEHRKCLNRGPKSNCLKIDNHGGTFPLFFCWRARTMIMVEEE